MLTKIKKIFVLVMFAAFLVVLSGCGGNEGGLKGALNDLYVETEVTEGFALPSVTLDGATTVWKSSNESVILIDGDYAEVIRPSQEDVKVTLTVEVILGEDTATKDFTVTVKCLGAPDAISINTDSFKAVEGEEKTYYIELGKSYELSIDVEDEEMSTEVTWTCQKSVTIVDGVLKGVKLGKAAIIATSTSNTKITDTITVIVVEDIIPGKVLLKYKTAITEAIPELIYKNHKFLIPENEQVKVTYYDGTGREIYDGEYTFVEGKDRKESIKCTIEYLGNTESFEFEIYVVNDPDENEFLAIKEVKETLGAIFDEYSQADGKMISEDIEFPSKYEIEVGEKTYTIELECDTECDYGTSPIQFEEVKKEDGTTVFKAVYTKPNDNTKLFANFDIVVVGVNGEEEKGNAGIAKKTLYALGYSPEEIVDYLKTNVLPQANEAGEYKVLCQHITLPTEDTTKKFKKLTISWSSSNESILTSTGKYANLDLDESTAVTMTATIEYAGTNGSIYQFTDSVAYSYSVEPATNVAQKVSLKFGDYIINNGLMKKIAYFPFGKTDRLDESGKVTNILPLPKTIGELAPEMTEYADLEVKWYADEEGLLSEEYKLLKQYLRYHEATLSYEIEVGGYKATNEITINVGLAEVKNTVYIGGPSYQSTATDDVSKADLLSCLSRFDEPLVSTSEAYRTWGKTNAQFCGVTFYVDVYEKDGNGDPTDEFTRYQYYVCTSSYLILDDMYKVYLADENDLGSAVVEINTELNGISSVENFGNNWPVVFHNASDKDVKVPFAPLSGQSFLGNSEVKWQTHPWTKDGYIKWCNGGIAVDAYRPGFVTDSEGKVIVGFGQTALQVNYDVNEDGSFNVDADGNLSGDGELTDADYWITIPAGGYIYSPRYQQNNIYSVLEGFCTRGNKINFVNFEPYHLSADGSNADLGSYVHPNV